MRTIHIDPTGHVKRCPDFPDRLPLVAISSGYEPINCNACFYACRGEAQAPLRLVSRVRDVMAYAAIRHRAATQLLFVNARRS